MGSQRVRHNLVTKDHQEACKFTHTITKTINTTTITFETWSSCNNFLFVCFSAKQAIRYLYTSVKIIIKKIKTWILNIRNTRRDSQILRHYQKEGILRKTNVNKFNNLQEIGKLSTRKKLLELTWNRKSKRLYYLLTIDFIVENICKETPRLAWIL